MEILEHLPVGSGASRRWRLRRRLGLRWGLGDFGGLEGAAGSRVGVLGGVLGGSDVHITTGTWARA